MRRGKQENIIVVERPPYYRPPRSRPVGLEKPANSSEHFQSTHQPQSPKRYIYIKQEPSASYENSFERDRRGQERRVQMLAGGNRGNCCNSRQPPSYNNLPKPFCRSASQRQIGAYSYRSELSPRPEASKVTLKSQQYPTSTVHKSMLGSHSPTGSGSLQPPARDHPTLGTSEASSEFRGANAAYESQLARRPNLEHCAETSTNAYPAGSESQSREAASEFLRATLARQTRRGEPSRGLRWTSKQVDSSTVLPDSKREEFMWDRQLERASIACQTYRTMPIVLPKPKARFDLANGPYMRLNYDPTWDLARSKPNPSRANADRRIRQAVNSNLGGPQQVRADEPNRVAGFNSSCVPSQHVCPSCPSHSADPRGFEQSAPTAVSPAFNYREYIESTRRAV